MKSRYPFKRTLDQTGFTLLETVVSLAILALALGVLYESFGWSLRRTASLEKQEIAWLTARSLLSEIRGRSALQVGADRGETAEGLKWLSQVAAHEARVDPRSPIKAFEVTIAVSWGNRPSQRIRLQSIETSRAAP